MEVYCGLIQFISCLYVLPVVPYQMKRVGYDETGSIIATTVCCAIGSIIAAFLTDMPFIVAPPTSVSIFLAVSMQQQGLSKDAGMTTQRFLTVGSNHQYPFVVGVSFLICIRGNHHGKHPGHMTSSSLLPFFFF